VPFFIFSLGSGLLVLGLTLLIIKATTPLTKVKTSGGKAKIILIGLSVACSGLIVLLMSLKNTSTERETMMTTGGNIIALGLTTLLQVGYNRRTEKWLHYGTWGTIGLGFLLCIIYEMFGA
jgi:hypothetical protein